jgi:hypothetical protein
MKKLTTLILIFTVFFTVSAFAEVKVNRIAISKSIQNREPVQAQNEFKNDVKKLYCFTEIVTDKFPTKVVHIWLYKDNIVAEVPLNVNSKKWRTYSSKKISPTAIGDWKVEIYSEDGKLIDSINFTVKE